MHFCQKGFKRESEVDFLYSVHSHAALVRCSGKNKSSVAIFSNKNIWTIHPTTDKWIRESKILTSGAKRDTFDRPSQQWSLVSKFISFRTAPLQQSEQYLWTILSSSTKHFTVGLQMACGEQCSHYYAGFTRLFIKCCVEKGQCLVFVRMLQKASNCWTMWNRCCAPMIFLI